MKPVHWMGSSRRDLRQFPKEVRRAIGYALESAQNDDRHASAKPLAGFGGAGVLEIVEDFRGDAYRGIYTVRFADAVYVLHVFMKKSKKGIATPRRELDLIRTRLKKAKEEYEQWLRSRSR